MRTYDRAYKQLTEKAPGWLRPSAVVFAGQATFVGANLTLALPILVILALVGTMSWLDVLTLVEFVIAMVFVTCLAGGVVYTMVTGMLRWIGPTAAYVGAFAGAAAYSVALLALMNLASAVRRDPTLGLHGPAAWLGASLLTLIGGFGVSAALHDQHKKQRHKQHHSHDRHAV